MGKGNNTIRKEVLEKFSTEDKCLEVLFRARYGNTESCPKCKQPFSYYRIRKRRCYSCRYCANHIYPTKNTIFERSTTSIPTWIEFMVDFLDDHKGVSAHGLSKEHGLTNKAAFRMAHKIREGFKNTFPPILSGTIYIDEHYHGGKRKLKTDKGKMGIGDKLVVFGLLANKTTLRMFYIKKKDAKTIQPLIYGNVEKGSIIHHDSNPTYGDLEAAGYIPKRVKNKASKEFRGINNNNIESQWSRMKRNILATYCAVSPKYLQGYLDEYSFRYNYRGEKLYNSLFEVIINISLNPLQEQVSEAAS